MSRLRSLLDAHPAIRSLYEEALKLSDAEVRAMGELLTAAGTERSSFMDQAAWRFAQSVFDEPANRRCADCGSAQLVTWASMLVLGEAAAGVATHAVVLCNQCCGGHRALGTHVAKPLSLKMDEWGEEQRRLLLATGNRAVNQVYEVHEAAGLLKPSALWAV